MILFFTPSSIFLHLPPSTIVFDEVSLNLNYAIKLFLHIMFLQPFFTGGSILMIATLFDTFKTYYYQLVIIIKIKLTIKLKVDKFLWVQKSTIFIRNALKVSLKKIQRYRRSLRPDSWISAKNALRRGSGLYCYGSLRSIGRVHCKSSLRIFF